MRLSDLLHYSVGVLILFWTTRIAGILFILFLSLCALDVFDMRLDFWGTLLAVLMHLIPSIVLAIALALAWNLWRRKICPVMVETRP
jgi:hypothetical protein